MSTQLDSSINLKKESSWGVLETPDTAYPFTEETFEYIPTFSEGVGHRAGARVPASSQRVLTKEEVGGELTVEMMTKGLGKLFEAALGVGTSTLINGSSYQQLFTPLVDDYLPSYSIQKAIPLIGGAVQPQTFLGMVCSGFELSAENAGIPTLKFPFVGKSVETSTGFQALAYASGVKLLTFVHGAITIGGSVTPPTTTALGTGGTAVATIRQFGLTYDNGLDTEGFNFGASGRRARKPVVNWRRITGSLVAEYSSNTLRDAWLAQTDLAIVLTFQDTSVAISGSNYPTVQITIPVARLDGELPKATFDGPQSQSIAFTGLDGGVATHPIYVAIVTAETAI